MKTQIKTILSIGVILLSASASAVENNKLVSVCGHSNVSVKQQVNIDPSTSVSILQGGMMRIDSAGPEPTEQLLKAEMVNIGISSECTEYFVSQGQHNPMNGRVYFAFDSDRLTPTSVAILDTMLEQLRSAEKSILLEGHTDSIGSDGYNFSLGMKRAMSVQDFLQDNSVDQQNIEAVSYGEKNPIASNNSAEGRKLNRRVEVRSH